MQLSYICQSCYTMLIIDESMTDDIALICPCGKPLTEFMIEFRKTVGDYDWLRLHYRYIQNILPSTWTLAEEFNFGKIGDGFKEIGVNFKTDIELNNAIAFMAAIGILEIQGFYGRVNPNFEWEDR